MHHVIIGTGPAGVTAAETLRKMDHSARITLIGDEGEPPYSRMALPYFLMQQIDEAGTYLRKKPGYFQTLKIELLHKRVAKVIANQNRLQLTDGNYLEFNKLLLATGSKPIIPPIPGSDLPGIVNCWTLDDGRRIAEKLRPGSKIVLMGAGFIGCIILEALYKSGAELTVIEMADRMVPRMMNAKAGGLIKQWCLNKGVNIQTNTKVTAFSQAADDSRLTVRLDNDKTISADFVVSASGVRPHTDFLKDSGIAIDQGILVNCHMQTNFPDIYAAGDAAQGLDFSTGEYSVQAIQPTASDHGQLAARNMAGAANALHQGSIDMNILDTMGLIACSFGLWQGKEQGESTECYQPERYQYINLQFHDDYLVGATAVGLTQHIGILRGLIQSRIKLKDWKQRMFKDPTRIMEAYLGSTQALGFNADLL